jgi:hypothetical protein
MTTREAKAGGVAADTSTLPELPVITFAADGCVLGHWNSVAIAVWATQATTALLCELETLEDGMLATKSRMSVVHLVVKGASLPGAEARARLMELQQRYAPSIVCAAVLLQGSGFWASALRSLVTSMQMVERSHFEYRTFAEVADLAEWVATLQQAAGGEAMDARALTRVLLWMLDRELAQRTRSPG